MQCQHVFLEWPQTRDYVNSRTVGMGFGLKCGENKTIVECSLYELAFPAKYGHENTLSGWWSSETSITGTLQQAVGTSWHHDSSASVTSVPPGKLVECSLGQEVTNSC